MPAAPVETSDAKVEFARHVELNLGEFVALLPSRHRRTRENALRKYALAVGCEL